MRVSYLQWFLFVMYWIIAYKLVMIHLPWQPTFMVNCWSQVSKILCPASLPSINWSMAYSSNTWTHWALHKTIGHIFYEVSTYICTRVHTLKHAAHCVQNSLVFTVPGGPVGKPVETEKEEKIDIRQSLCVGINFSTLTAILALMSCHKHCSLVLGLSRFFVVVVFFCSSVTVCRDQFEYNGQATKK